MGRQERGAVERLLWEIEAERLMREDSPHRRALLSRARGGDVEALAQIVLGFRTLVRVAAQQVEGPCEPSRMDALCAWGIEGLYEAVQNISPQYDDVFESIAKYYVKRKILNHAAE